ncbi:class I SAM-dependent methyltransferase [Actinoallomurus iriomotensis]|uniref:Methyltransferase n=1 Tax=Actinoallomurus iriomotensis TaxID=478107 RepID=A0A9W6RDI6_9ACTN|nr:class I SAM-dependent methyltransferase [Actinoallomurus iriomotensis]GLY73798.1 methyltransferase [Actinoallomurus iriomotensis]
MSTSQAKPTVPTPSADGYVDGVLANTAVRTRERLDVLDALFAPATERVLTDLDLPASGRFAEIGAGGGATARWLARARPGATVLATDIDPALFDGAGLPNLSIVRHDVRTGRLPAAAFDLVHCRAVLSHIPDRERVIRRMSEWVAPGGWLVIEEPLICPLGDSAYPAFGRLTTAIEEVLRRTGTDVRWPRHVARSLGELGWADLGMSALMCPCYRGSLGNEAMRLTAVQALPPMVENGVLSPEEAEAGLACLDDKAFAEIGFSLISAWTRRPS